MTDAVDHPPHYTAHPSGVECIQITEHMNFCVGNAVKYLWRAGQKGDAIEDLRKAAWYIEREIKRLSKIKDAKAREAFTEYERAQQHPPRTVLLNSLLPNDFDCNDINS